MDQQNIKTDLSSNNQRTLDNSTLETRQNILLYLSEMAQAAVALNFLQLKTQKKFT